METGRECVCCKEVSRVMDKVDELDESSVSVECITEHPGFASVLRQPTTNTISIMEVGQVLHQYISGPKSCST